MNRTEDVFRRSHAPGQSWQEWRPFDAPMRTVAAETNADGRMELFAANNLGQIFHRRQTGPGAATWTPWTPMDGNVTALAVTRRADGRRRRRRPDQTGPRHHHPVPQRSDLRPRHHRRR